VVSSLQLKRDTSRLEDYLEAIYQLQQEKGYVSTIELASRLGVKPPTVSSMVARLAKDGYVEYEPYRGMRLTDSGAKLARSVIRRHETIEEFLSMLGVDKAVAFADAEGIEHHLQPSTVLVLERLVRFLKMNPKHLEAIKDDLEND
jgi:Mn-dependent DtxR family transcriptional regulator